MIKRTLVTWAVCFVALAAWQPVVAGEWKGQEAVKDGVKHVMNPAAGAEQSTAYKLEELWRLGGDTDDEDEFFGVIAQILADDEGNVYLLDSQLAQVRIFSSNGEFIRAIGREGEGPGEFKSPTGMFFTADGNIGVVQVQPGKIVLLSPDGEPAGEHPLPKQEDGGFINLVGGQANGNNLVLAAALSAFSEGKFEQTRYLASIDGEGNELARYCSDVRTIDFANASMDEVAWDTFDRRWVVDQKGRVFAATSFSDYQIKVWNADGTPERVIEREYKHRKRTPQESKVLEDLYGIFARRIPNSTVNVSDYHKDIESFYLRDDGSIWVLTSDGSRGLPEGIVGTFDVYDKDGHILRQVTLKGEGDSLTDGYYFVKDRLYVVTDLLQAAISQQAGGESFQIGEEEPEPMSVIAYQLDGDLLTLSR
ncbi:MAG: 6-bladed beta-propeller [Candidatus Krumholzibacteriia bacterium]